MYTFFIRFFFVSKLTCERYYWLSISLFDPLYLFPQFFFLLFHIISNDNWTHLVGNELCYFSISKRCSDVNECEHNDRNNFYFMNKFCFVFTLWIKVIVLLVCWCEWCNAMWMILQFSATQIWRKKKKQKKSENFQLNETTLLFQYYYYFLFYYYEQCFFLLSIIKNHIKNCFVFAVCLILLHKRIAIKYLFNLIF